MRRVPSHGTHLLGTTYAIDFVGVDERDRTAPGVSWRTAFATESPEPFFAFGRPVRAPIGGLVVAVHQGEPDHAARRSPLTLATYSLGQSARLRRGLGAISGNCVTIAGQDGAFVAVMHLQADSIRVSVGQGVAEGEHIANCGNSGNSTQPHVHVQAMDALDPWAAHGLPMRIKSFLEKPRGSRNFARREHTLPNEAATVAPAE